MTTTTSQFAYVVIADINNQAIPINLAGRFGMFLKKYINNTIYFHMKHDVYSSMYSNGFRLEESQQLDEMIAVFKEKYKHHTLAIYDFYSHLLLQFEMKEAI